MYERGGHWEYEIEIGCSDVTGGAPAFAESRFSISIGNNAPCYYAPPPEYYAPTRPTCSTLHEALIAAGGALDIGVKVAIGSTNGPNGMVCATIKRRSIGNSGTSNGMSEMTIKALNTVQHMGRRVLAFTATIIDHGSHPVCTDRSTRSGLARFRDDGLQRNPIVSRG